MKLKLLITLIFLIIYAFDVKARGNRPKPRSRPRNYQSSFSKLKKSSGLPWNKKMLLASGGLAAAYIGFKMASHKDISRYTVCEGRRVEFDEMGVQREYLYTVCPSHLRYCCRSDAYEGERCCSGRSYYTYSQPQGTVFGSMFGTLVMVIGFGLIVYFCCLRPRRQKRSSMVQSSARGDDGGFPPQLPTPGSFVSVGGHVPAFESSGPTYHVPVTKPEDYFDKPPPYSGPLPPSSMAPPSYEDVVQPNSSSSLPYAPSKPGPPGSGWAATPSHPTASSFHAPPPAASSPPYPTS